MTLIDRLNFEQFHEWFDEHKKRRPNCGCNYCEFDKLVTQPTLANIRRCFEDVKVVRLKAREAQDV